MAPNRTNILFCLADDAGLHFGAYGTPWVNTPAFDRVARDGLLFTQAFTCNAKCAPSRSSILTGRNSWQLKDAANHQCRFPAEFKTVFEALGENGYHVGHTGKGWAPGDPGMVGGRPRLLAGPEYQERQWTPPTTLMSSCDYAANFEAFLDDRPAGSPFCFWYGCREPHRAYEYRSGIEKNGRRPEEIDRVPPIWPDNEVVRADLLDYGFALENFDLHLGRMLEILEARGERENTLVVATSDNGMPFPRIKGQEYAYSNHLPLAMLWPAGIRKPGRRIEDMVGFIDFAPTFLEVAGVAAERSGMAPITGRSLTDIFGSERGGVVDAGRDRMLIGKERHDLGRPGDVGYPIRGLFKGGYLYLRNFEPERWPCGNPETGYMNCDGSPTKTEILKRRHDPSEAKYWEWCFGKRPAEELYDVGADPACLRNRAAEPAFESLRRSMDEEMTRALIEQGDPRIRGDRPPLDESPSAFEEINNYYERFLKGEIGVAGWINATDVQEG